MKHVWNSAAWVGLLISVTLISVIWLGFTTLRNTGLFQTSEQELAQKVGDVRLIESTMGAYRDAENSLRGFFLTDEHGLLVEFHTALEHTEELAQQLRSNYHTQADDLEVYRQFQQTLAARVKILRQSATQASSLQDTQGERRTEQGPQGARLQIRR